jgi:hypothetical protein
MIQIQHTFSTLATQAMLWLRPIGHALDCTAKGNSMSFSKKENYPNIGPFYEQLR